MPCLRPGAAKLEDHCSKQSPYREVHVVDWQVHPLGDEGAKSGISFSGSTRHVGSKVSTTPSSRKCYLCLPY